MPSLQAYTSHRKRRYRIVESNRKEGNPRIRVLAFLGKAEEILRLIQKGEPAVRVRSCMAGAVCALCRLGKELDVAGSVPEFCCRERARRRSETS